MQRQSEPVHYQPDPPERFPGLGLRAAHGHEVIGISDQYSKLATPRRPDPIQLVQVDVSEQRRDYGLNAKDNFQFDRAVSYRQEGQAT
jgi:hypothetical protein